MWNESKKRLHYDELPNELKTHRNRVSFHNSFKVVDGEGKSHAVVAHFSKDGALFYPPGHQPSRITDSKGGSSESNLSPIILKDPGPANMSKLGMQYFR